MKTLDPLVPPFPRPASLLERFAPPGSNEARLLGRLHAVILAGVAMGVLIGGIGGRLAMLVLRLTSSDSVRGVISDDGFEIGRVTLGGTYALLGLGAAIGLIGAGAYGLVAPWLIGPAWFRRVTSAFGAGAVVGSMLVHADGVDFTLLQPTWLAIALFVALPALFGAFIGDALAYCERADSWVKAGPRRRWLLPVAAIAFFPPIVVIVGIIALILTLGWAIRLDPRFERLHVNRAYGFAVRALWLVIALAGLAVLAGDVVQIT